MAPIADLYTALALPPLPMHLTVFLKHGGAGAGPVVVDEGRIMAMSEEAIDHMVEFALRRGPAEASRRGAKLPLEGSVKELAQQILARPETKPEATGKVWGSLLSRMKSGDHLNHKDRFRLLMSMLRSGWTDEEVHAAYANSSDYSFTITDGHLKHARQKYLG